MLPQRMISPRQIQSHERARQLEEFLVCRKAIEAALRAIATNFPDVLIGDFEFRLGALIAQTPLHSSSMPMEGVLACMRSLRREVETAFQQASKEAVGGPSSHPGDFPLRLILDACPCLSDYLPAPVSNQNELVLAGKFLRGSIEVDLGTWHYAAETLGPVRAAILALFLLQKRHDDVTFGYGMMKKPAGLFKSLVRSIADNTFDLKDELEAMRKRHMT